MIRGTTAQFRFKIPYRKEELQWATMKFWQDGNTGTITAPLPITKKLEHCQLPMDAQEICVSLTAEETSRFSDKLKAKAQIRAQSLDGTIFASQEQNIPVYPINDDILDEDPTLPAVDETGWIILDAGSIASNGGVS